MVTGGGSNCLSRYGAADDVLDRGDGLPAGVVLPPGRGDSWTVDLGASRLTYIGRRVSLGRCTGDVAPKEAFWTVSEATTT